MTARPTIETQLTTWVEHVLTRLYDQVDISQVNTKVVATTDDRHGDYQCNAALALAKAVGQAPRQIAERVVAEPPLECVSTLEVAGPGFINFTLKTEWLEAAVAEIGRHPKLDVPQIGDGRTVVIDYSSPNIAKPMHIGHIRSTVIGNALDRIFRFLGYKVIADNHVGDWGTQFGLMLIGYRKFVDQEALKTSPIDELERIYRASYERSKADDSWLNKAREELVNLQQGNEANRELWQQFIDLSKVEFNRVYGRLGVQFDLERGESYYNDKLQPVLDALEEKGLCEESEGALVVNLEDEGLPVSMVRKSDGGFNYTTTDLATAINRYEEFDPDQVIYVTDERQQLHFKQFFSIFRRLGYELSLKHVWFGLMRLPHATFSTREGNVIKLESLLDEAERRALELVRSSNTPLDEAKQRDVARAVGIGAVKYADLSQNPQSTVTFTWEKAMSLEGNSAPYLQYAYARIASVQDKYGERFPEGDLGRLADSFDRTD